MTRERELLQQALDALEEAAFAKLPDGTYCGKNATLPAAIRELLAKPEGDEIERLRQRVAELEQDLLNTSDSLGHVSLDFAACEKERDELKELHASNAYNCNYHKAKAEASQAREQKLREALSLCRPQDHAPILHHQIYNAALALPHDTSALDALVKEAARYRWLKDRKFRWNGHCWHSQFGQVLPHKELDAAIDAAMGGKCL